MRATGSGYRIAVTAPKTIDKRATVRNKLRRRGTAILGPLASRFPIPMDIVLVFEKGAAIISFSELRAGIETIFQKVSQSL